MRSVGVSNRQFTSGCKDHDKGRDCALGKSFCRACVANAGRYAAVKKLKLPVIINSDTVIRIFSLAWLYNRAGLG